MGGILNETTKYLTNVLPYLKIGNPSLLYNNLSGGSRGAQIGGVVGGEPEFEPKEEFQEWYSRRVVDPTTQTSIIADK